MNLLLSDRWGVIVVNEAHLVANAFRRCLEIQRLLDRSHRPRGRADGYDMSTRRTPVLKTENPGAVVTAAR